MPVGVWSRLTLMWLITDRANLHDRIHALDRLIEPIYDDAKVASAEGYTGMMVRSLAAGLLYGVRVPVVPYSEHDESHRRFDHAVFGTAPTPERKAFKLIDLAYNDRTQRCDEGHEPTTTGVLAHLLHALKSIDVGQIAFVVMHASTKLQQAMAKRGDEHHKEAAHVVLVLRVDDASDDDGHADIGLRVLEWERPPPHVQSEKAEIYLKFWEKSQRNQGMENFAYRLLLAGVRVPFTTPITSRD